MPRVAPERRSDEEAALLPVWAQAPEASARAQAWPLPPVQQWRVPRVWAQAEVKPEPPGAQLGAQALASEELAPQALPLPRATEEQVDAQPPGPVPQA